MSTVNETKVRRQNREIEFQRCSIDSIAHWVQELRRQLLPFRDLLDLSEILTLARAGEGAVIEGEWILMTAQTFGEPFYDKIQELLASLRVYVATLADLHAVKNDAREKLEQSLGEALRAVFEIKKAKKL